MPTQTTFPWQQIATQGVGAVLDTLSTEESMRLADEYGTHNYKPLPVNVVRGEGARVWDSEGVEYIDCIGAYSAVAHGHLSPAVVRALQEQLTRVTLVSRAFFSPELALFLHALAEYTGLDMSCPMNSGAEANETCIKLARKWAYTVKGVPKDKAEIIVTTDNFHGRTTTIVGFSSETKYKEMFGPFGPGFVEVPYGDLAALEAAITPNTCAFLAEPLQAEGGIIIPPDGYMAGVRQLCDKHNMLLIWDEVQTGFGRTGRKFGWQWEDAEPDLMAVGKPLGGGVLPVSAAVGKRHVMEILEPGDHGSTFGGNPLAAAVGIAALAEMEVHDYAGRSERLGRRLAEGFRALNSPLVKEVRDRGLLVGVEVHSHVDSAALTKALLDERIVTKETRKRTFRFTPPIVTDEATIDEIIARVGRALVAVAANA